MFEKTSWQVYIGSKGEVESLGMLSDKTIVLIQEMRFGTCDVLLKMRRHMDSWRSAPVEFVVGFSVRRLLR